MLDSPAFEYQLGGERLYLLQKVPDLLWVPLSHLFNEYRSSVPVKNAQGVNLTTPI
jgi:hypothetical protein